MSESQSPDPFDPESIRIDPNNWPKSVPPLSPPNREWQEEFNRRPITEKDRITPSEALAVIAQVIDGEAHSMFDDAVSAAAAELYPLVDGGLGVDELTELIATKFIELDYGVPRPVDVPRYGYAVEFVGRFDMWEGIGCYIEFSGTALVQIQRDDWGVVTLVVNKQDWHYPENWSDHPSHGRLVLFSSEELKAELTTREKEEAIHREQEAAAYDPEWDLP